MGGDDVEGEVRAQKGGLENHEGEHHQREQRVDGAATGDNELRPAAAGTEHRRADAIDGDEQSHDQQPATDQRHGSLAVGTTFSGARRRPGTWRGTWWSANLVPPRM